MVWNFEVGLVEGIVANSVGEVKRILVDFRETSGKIYIPEDFLSLV